MTENASYAEDKKKTGVLGKIGRHVSGFFTSKNAVKNMGVSDVRCKETVIHEGFIRKKNSSSVVSKAMDTLNIKWNLFYVLVTNKNIYYFKNEDAPKFAGKFSLYGYNKVTRVPAYLQGTGHWPEHCFMIVHASGDSHMYNSYYFAVSRPSEQPTWIFNVRKALLTANESLVSMALRHQVEQTQVSQDVADLEEEIYSTEQFTMQNQGADDDIIESDDEDYTFIDDNILPHLSPSRHKMSSDPEPPPRPKRGQLGSMASQASSEGYMDFDENDRIAKRAPPYSPGSQGSSLDSHYRAPPPDSPSLGGDNNNLPKFLNVPNSPANEVLRELSDRQKQHQNRSPASKVFSELAIKAQEIKKSQFGRKPPPSPPADHSAEQSFDSIPISEAPRKPFTLNKPAPPPASSKPKPPPAGNKPKPPPPSSKPKPSSKSEEEETKPLPPVPNHPITAKKPTLQVKPRVQPDRIYWNGDRADCNEYLKDSAIGIFMVRRSENDGRRVLVISGGDSTTHQVKLTDYSEGTLGLKSEATVADHEKFASVEDLIKYYKSNCIYLRGGTLQIKLQRPHHECEEELSEW